MRLGILARKLRASYLTFISSTRLIISWVNYCCMLYRSTCQQAAQRSYYRSSVSTSTGSSALHKYGLGISLRAVCKHVCFLFHPQDALFHESTTDPCSAAQLVSKPFSAAIIVQVYPHRQAVQHYIEDMAEPID